MVHSSKLPSRQLTKVANELGRLQRVIKERGGDLAGYVETYKHTSTLPESSPAEYAERMYKADAQALAALRAEYERLQLERAEDARAELESISTAATTRHRTSRKKIG